MRFCDIKTVGELIDALQHFNGLLPVEMVFESYAHRTIESVEFGETDHDRGIIRIVAHDD